MAPEQVSKRASKSKPKKLSPPVKTFKSPETIDDSDDSSSSGNNAQPTKTKITAKVTSVDNGKSAKKRKIDVAQEAQLPTAKTNGHVAIDISSDESSLDTDSDAEDAGKEADSDDGEQQDTEMHDAAESSEETDSESEDDGIPLTTPQKQSLSSRPATAKPATTVASKVVDDWKPPKEFSRTTLAASSHTRKLLRPSALKGKQLWHISIPDHLDNDLSKLKSLDPTRIQHGQSILTAKTGQAYTFRETKKRDLQGVRVLAPDDGENVYQQVTARISRTLDLQQIMPAANEAEGDQAEESEETAGLDPKLLVAQRTYEKDPPPVQPVGLKVMNVPIGVVVSEEQRRDLVTLKKSRTAQDLAAVEVNGHDEVNGGSQKKERDGETPEERAQRKAEKARRKEQKKLAKAAAK